MESIQSIDKYLREQPKATPKPKRLGKGFDEILKAEMGRINNEQDKLISRS